MEEEAGCGKDFIGTEMIRGVFFMKALNSYDPYARFMDEMTIPEDMENCYLISYCDSAPFADNIIGH